MTIPTIVAIGATHVINTYLLATVLASPTGIDFQAPVLDYQPTHGEWRWWPLLHLAPQGKIFHSGPTPTMGWINTAGSGQYEDTGIRYTYIYGEWMVYDLGSIGKDNQLLVGTTEGVAFGLALDF